MKPRGRERRGRPKRNRSTTMIEIVKPPADSRGYRVVILPNGITAMLISENSSFITNSKRLNPTELMEIDELYSDGEAAAALCIGVGSFSDLPEIPGFAHFMEHMVFMGSKKFPKENYWDDYLAQNGGESNAWTDCERTCFFFVCHQNSFIKALDIFAQFFISPLFNKNSVDREILAVDNEFQMVSSRDNERMRSIMAYELVETGHPMAKFMAGNKKSLKDDPLKNNINVYEQLHSFYRRMYSAHYMTLVVHAMDDLDTIENYIIRIFSPIPNNEIPRPKFIKPPFQEKKLNKLVKVIPIEDVHKMEIIWALPPLMEHYRARVIEYLSLVIGHEGKGSILSYLQKRHLALEIAGGNDMTGYTHNSTWSAFILTIKLTEHGFLNYEEVLEVIFQYINILKVTLPAHVFEEQKHIQETKYIFKEQESIYNYVEELAENMHMFPPEHYLCGRNLFFEYNEQLIRDCLDFLRPQGMMVMLFNQEYSQLPNLCEEPWLGTKYLAQSVDDALITRLLNVSPNPELKLPDPNPYIATDFSLIKVKKSSKYPVVVMNKDGLRMWYKKDNTYHMPNAYIYFHFISPAISKNEHSIALGDVYMTLLLQQLTETLYNATLAGYEYSFDGTPEGVIFIIGGYSEKIKLVAADMLKVFQNFQTNEDNFNSVLTHLKQFYINKLIKPVELASSVRYRLLEQKDPSLCNRYKHLDSVNYSMLKEFVEEMFSSLFIEGFVTGNLFPQDALDIGELALPLIKKPLPFEDIPKPLVLELPEGDFKCFMSSVNKEDTNSCVVHYYQLGLGSIMNTCLNDLLAAAMNEPLFNVLRTEFQLGYSVYCQPCTTHGVLGFLLVVESQANKFSMKSIDEIMTKFLRDFEKNIEEMPPAKFKDMVESHASVKISEDADLYDESSAYWHEIVKQSYMFDRLKLEYEALQQLTQKDLLNWYKQLISNKQRKLSVMIEGCSRSKVSCGDAPTDMEPSLKTIRTGIKEFKAAIKSAITMRPLCKVTSKTDLVELQNLGVNYITDMCEFKSKMTLLPHHVINK
ncbi:nardilysin-like [Physella acuta]|uniref:nardilysin-like n=1 Tax=Physella acuta TaxID=109671 RepID=UPI0027DB7168|nr:nardilysin-like [Physella acuta]XP_059179180.1 nardilysin-like [Physella acuta]XP_059179181.1 nardilysin-like [Physella acuta]